MTAHSPRARGASNWRLRLGIHLSTAAILILIVWTRIDCLPLTVYAGEKVWYTECPPFTPFFRVVLSLILILLAAIAIEVGFLVARRRARRAGE